MHVNDVKSCGLAVANSISIYVGAPTRYQVSPLAVCCAPHPPTAAGCCKSAKLVALPKMVCLLLRNMGQVAKSPHFNFLFAAHYDYDSSNDDIAEMSAVTAPLCILRPFPLRCRHGLDNFSFLCNTRCTRFIMLRTTSCSSVRAIEASSEEGSFAVSSFSSMYSELCTYGSS